MLKLKLQYFQHLMRSVESLEKTLMLGNVENRKRMGLQRMRCLEWHYRLNVHEFEPALGVSDGQGSLVCCSLLGGIINLMNMSLSKLWELVMNREAWRAAPHDIAKSWT